MDKASLHPRLFDEYLLGLQDNMYSFALSLTADKERAEDLTQDTTLKVLVNRNKYKENTNFKGWVFTVMRNLFYNDYHKSVRTRNLIDMHEDISEVAPVCDSANISMPEQELSLSEINEVIDSLRDEYKAPLSMYISGYKYKEIATALDLPIGTVKSRIFFARKRLQERLADYVGDR